MRLLTFAAVGAALVAAGLVAPVSVEEGPEPASLELGPPGDEMRFGPQVARPGQRVRIEVLGCAPGRHRIESRAFTHGQARLAGRTGTVELKRVLGAGTYPVVAHCGEREVTGRLAVSTERSWPSLLPGALSPQLSRAADH